MPEILEILNIPRVVATVHRFEDLEFVSENDLSGLCDCLEFRLDSLRDCLDRAGAVIRAIGSEMPCLVTARDPAEGGEGNLALEDRIGLLRRFLPHAAFVDVESGSIREFAPLIREAHDIGVAVIASFHDFDSMPAVSKLERAGESGDAAHADVVKLAVRLDQLCDLGRLVEFTEAAVRDGSHLSAMGMGPLGKLSRLTLAAAGSCLNYGYLHEPNAPGQWPAKELMRLYGELGLR